MIEWIKQHKYAVIITALSILLFCCSCLFISAALNNKPAPVQTPTTITKTLTETEYVVKINQWSKQGNDVMTVIVAVLSGENVSKQTLADTGAQLSLLKADVENTIPPVGYEEIHQHYTQAIQDVYDGVVAMSRGTTKVSSAKFVHANQELDTVRELLKKKSLILSI